MKTLYTLLISSLLAMQSYGQMVHGEVIDAGSGMHVPATISSLDSSRFAVCDARGKFNWELQGDSLLVVTAIGYRRTIVAIESGKHLQVLLVPDGKEMDAVVVTGTMRAVSRTESPVAVEVYTPQFFRKNPTPSIFESLQNVNGVRPQLNCSVCNTGDIHINGLEGPYTMITIDGMPIVSSLSSVYGLFGIPTQMIERVEIVKGPASGLYGAEAIGGLINVITKAPGKAPLFSASVMSTSWLEHSVDLGFKLRAGKRAVSLLGVNYFNYGNKQDQNHDRFTDVTLQHRVSVFNKWNFTRKHDRVASIAARYFYEDRWGGDMRWNRSFRGGDSLYGESIYTNRYELIGNYQLPTSEQLVLSFSGTWHDQNSYYGVTPYMGKQGIAFGQLVWTKDLGLHHNFLGGAAVRYNYYDDNSTATMDTLTFRNHADNYLVPGIFLQDEWKISNRHMLLLGLRFDHHNVHKLITTPRIAWKWSMKDHQVLRINAGTGFRVVSLFTEDHAALTGARAVEIRESLKPERSYNINLNYTRQHRWNNVSLGTDLSVWYSYFTNQIIADYDTDPGKIIYENLDGHAASRGVTLNLEFNIGNRFKSMIGSTIQDVTKTERNSSGKKESIRPMLTENFSGTWSLSYSFPGIGLAIDYTGNLYGPMRLPLLSSTDPRPAYSPAWSLQNIQFTKILSSRVEMFGGVKNLLNWTPAKKVPFLIARSEDPFDKQVNYDGAGNIVATPGNPYALSFDPSYAYAPNQGIRVFAGIRVTVR